MLLSVAFAASYCNPNTPLESIATALLYLETTQRLTNTTAQTESASPNNLLQVSCFVGSERVRDRLREHT